MSEEHEPTTDMVIDWLVHYNADFVRINTSSKIIIKKILFVSNTGLEKFLVSIDGRNIDLCDAKAYWYRRGELSICNHSAALRLSSC